MIAVFLKRIYTRQFPMRFCVSVPFVRMNNVEASALSLKEWTAHSKKRISFPHGSMFFWNICPLYPLVCRMFREVCAYLPQICTYSSVVSPLREKRRTGNMENCMDFGSEPPIKLNVWLLFCAIPPWKWEARIRFTLVML